MNEQWRFSCSQNKPETRTVQTEIDGTSIITTGNDSDSGIYHLADSRLRHGNITQYNTSCHCHNPSTYISPLLCQRVTPTNLLNSIRQNHRPGLAGAYCDDAKQTPTMSYDLFLPVSYSTSFRI